MRLETWQTSLAASLTADGGPWPPAALAVHRRNMHGARLQALEQTYPVLHKVLGARCFARLAREYPGREADLNFYGRAFPLWLKSQSAVQPALADYPYLADLARLEWALHLAYYAPDDPPLDPEQFARASGAPSDWRLRLSASLTLLSSPWPVLAVWRANRAERSASGVPAGRCGAAIWRHGSRARAMHVPAAPWSVLQGARSGESIATLSGAGLTEHHMGRLLRLGWVTGAEPIR